MGNPSSASSPNTGDIAVWNYTRNITGAGELGQIQGVPAPSAIFVLKNRAGEAQFLNRATAGVPATINTASNV